ncbi:MAG: putative baseplate assembly protein [Acidobacteriia bacterium]|nr:putative baseplate assembly protein [Terriglobia bacterium]
MAKRCGCTTSTCECCEGARILTPIGIENRPGLPAIRYRAGTHGTFLETMKARLASMTVDERYAQGGAARSVQPLRGLTTRDGSDPSIALLDGWATVGDVLTFYQERIANEGYLRTATERRSILELARLVGYQLRPGVAAGVFLGYTLDDNQTVPVMIPAGSRSQSVPVQGSGELPQSFETSDDLTARAEWNNLQVRLTQPQDISWTEVLSTNEIYLKAPGPSLKTGDLLLLVFDENTSRFAVRTVERTEGQFTDQRIVVHLQPVTKALQDIVAAIEKFLNDAADTIAKKKINMSSYSSVGGLLQRAKQVVDSAYLGSTAAYSMYLQFVQFRRTLDSGNNMAGHVTAAKFEENISAKNVLGNDNFKWLRELGSNWTKIATDINDLGLTDSLQAFFATIRQLSIETPELRVHTTDPSNFVRDLLKQPSVQPPGSVNLRRSLKSSFTKKSDAAAQLLMSFAPQIKGTFYKAWSNAIVNARTPSLKAVYVLRTAASLFGAGAAKIVTYDNSKPPVPQTSEWPIADDESRETMFLDQPNDSILQSSYVLAQAPVSENLRRSVHRVISAQVTPRTAYGISGKATKLTLADDWRPENDETPMETLRGTYIYGQGEQLELAEEPLSDAVTGPKLELDGLYQGLESGRWIILSGERTDIPRVSGVNSSEPAMISAVVQSFNGKLPGDKAHTTLTLHTGTAYAYKRSTLKIYGNVVKATHGESRIEALGSGDGSQSLQSFDLKQPPVTYISAENPEGVTSTLKVYVNDIEWHEADTLAGLGPKDRNFISTTDDKGLTTVSFGNGQSGARLPTGVQNVRAVYRNGIGKAGNVLAGQISQLQSKPLGVKAVVNPLSAGGGADKETRDRARDNAPLAVMALNRLVSIPDYADFARTFAGIEKAVAVRVSDGFRPLVYLTIAGVDDIPIDAQSDLCRNLLGALRKYGDPGLGIKVDLRELKILVLSAGVRLEPDYLWGPVVTEIRAVLLDMFGFHQRALGQPVVLSEIIRAMQGVKGVAYVTVPGFSAVPEKITESSGARRMVDFGHITQSVIRPDHQQIIPAEPGSLKGGTFLPAELAIFVPEVQDTIILEQIP